jgi:hypothetical protein
VAWCEWSATNVPRSVVVRQDCAFIVDGVPVPLVRKDDTTRASQKQFLLRQFRKVASALQAWPGGEPVLTRAGVAGVSYPKQSKS